MALTIKQRIEREETAENIRFRLSRLRIKYRTVSDTLGVNLAHFQQMIVGDRPMTNYQTQIETIIQEYEEAEKRIKTKLYQ